MSEDKEDEKAPRLPRKPWTKAEASTKKKPAKKAAPVRASRYVVAEGRSITTTGRIIDAGEDISAADVADLEALVKGGYVVKA